MKLTKAQKKLVKKINDKDFNINFLEEYYGENAADKKKLSYSLAIMNCAKANAFMRAIDGIIKTL